MNAGQVRYQLAGALGDLYYTREAIVQAVQAKLPNIAVADVPEGPPRTTWMWLLQELHNKEDAEGLKAILDLGKDRSRRVDWDKFAAAVAIHETLESTQEAAGAAWSYVSIEVQWDDQKGAPAETSRIASKMLLLNATVTMQWEGKRPADPQLVAMSSRMFAGSEQLPSTLAPGPTQDGLATWTSRIPIDATQLRTRKVTLRCSGHDAQQKRLVTPKVGSFVAMGVWLAFALFAYAWLAPITPLLFTLPLPMLGLSGGIGPSIWNRLKPAAFWERAVFTVAVSALFVVALPPWLVVVATNTSGKDVVLQDEYTIGARARHEPFFVLGAPDLHHPKPPACVCGPADCACDDLPRKVRFVEHLSYGKLVEKRRTVIVDRTAAAARIDVAGRTFDNPTEISVPAVGPFTAAFVTRNGDGEGSLACSDTATYIIGIGAGPHDVQKIELDVDGEVSSWTGPMNLIRACARGSAPVSIQMDLGDALSCTAGKARILTFPVANVSHLEIVSAGVRSSWSAREARTRARACVADDANTIEIAALSVGAWIEIPVASGITHARYAGSETVPCTEGQRARLVGLVRVPDQNTLHAGTATIVRLATQTATGFTCDPDAHDGDCKLDATTLTCKEPPGPCELLRDGIVHPMKPDTVQPADCRDATLPNDLQRFRDSGLRCTKKWICDR